MFTACSRPEYRRRGEGAFGYGRTPGCVLQRLCHTVHSGRYTHKRWCARVYKRARMKHAHLYYFDIACACLWVALGVIYTGSRLLYSGSRSGRAVHYKASAGLPLLTHC